MGDSSLESQVELTDYTANIDIIEFVFYCNSQLRYFGEAIAVKIDS